MHAADILAYTRAIPFRPFRLILNSGKSYDVRHPEMIRVTLSSILYFHATDPEGPAESWETVSLSLIQNIVHIDAKPSAAASPSDGAGP